MSWAHTRREESAWELAKNTKGQRLAVVALTFNDEAALIDLDTKQTIATVKDRHRPLRSTRRPTKAPSRG